MRNGLQMGCLVLGILCFLYYIAIVLYAGLSSDFAWVWLIGALFFLTLRQVLLHTFAEPSSPWRFAAAGLGGLLAVAVLAILLVGSRIVCGMLAEPEENLEYVVILGAQIRGKTPSRALRKRLDRAAEYAKENPDTVFLLSGGQGTGEEIPEAEAMQKYLLDKGVEEGRLLLEDRSTSTYENLEYCGELVPDLKECTVGILSNNFHVYRAGALARKMGYSHISPIPAPSDIGMAPHYILREVCAILKEAAAGRMEF